jgi:hypothetical protein
MSCATFFSTSAWISSILWRHVTKPASLGVFGLLRHAVEAHAADAGGHFPPVVDFPEAGVDQRVQVLGLIQVLLRRHLITSSSEAFRISISPSTVVSA